MTSAAIALARFPHAKVSFVTNTVLATRELRRDLSSRRILLIDLGLTPELAKNIGRKRQQADLVLLDHHTQTLAYTHLLPSDVDRSVRPGESAAAVTWDWLERPDLTHLAALADLVEYCDSPALDQCIDHYGIDLLHEEARMLDFAWRWQVADDRFRRQTVRQLADGAWPSEIPEVQRRYLQMQNEGRWERALERVRRHVQIDGPVALLRFGRRKPSLFGFGSRALSAVAEEEGCRVALLVHRRNDVTSISARILPGDRPGRRKVRPELDLGRFFDEFTQQYGGAGGGHPESAGGRIPTRHLSEFLKELECFA